LIASRSSMCSFHDSDGADHRRDGDPRGVAVLSSRQVDAVVVPGVLEHPAIDQVAPWAGVGCRVVGVRAASGAQGEDLGRSHTCQVGDDHEACRDQVPVEDVDGVEVEPWLPRPAGDRRGGRGGQPARSAVRGCGVGPAWAFEHDPRLTDEGSGDAGEEQSGVSLFVSAVAAAGRDGVSALLQVFEERLDPRERVVTGVGFGSGVGGVM
jgi:hypothetical protein